MNAIDVVNEGKQQSVNSHYTIRCPFIRFSFSHIRRDVGLNLPGPIKLVICVSGILSIFCASSEGCELILPSSSLIDAFDVSPRAAILANFRLSAMDEELALG